MSSKYKIIVQDRLASAVLVVEEGNADDAENGFASEVKKGSADGRQLFFFLPALSEAVLNIACRTCL